MRQRKLRIVKLVAVAMAVTLFAASMIFNGSPRSEAAAGPAPAQTEEDRAPQPDPRVDSVEAEPLAEGETSEGNARLLVRFSASSRVGPQVKTVIEDREVTLRDDGEGGDAAAGDGTHSAIIFLDFNALAANQDQIDATNREAETAPSAAPAANGATSSRTGDAAAVASAEADEERLADDDSVRVPDFGTTRDRQGTQSFPKVDFRSAAPGKPVRLFPLATHRRVDPARSLVITDIRVVEDPRRTFNPCNNTGTPMGPWTFGRLMTEMANTPRTGIPASTFVRQWLNKWLANQTTANGWTAEQRLKMQTLVIDPWVAASGGPGRPLDLSKAPFRLLAIVNRVDLRGNSFYGGGSAGEGRFVFGVMDMRGNGGPATEISPAEDSSTVRAAVPAPTVQPGPGPGPYPGGGRCGATQFTVIVEYGIDRRGCGIRDWGRQWYNLRNFPLGSAAYNAALQAITDQFTRRDAAPGKPNGSALNQLRTNEIALNNPFPDDTWQMREFTLARPNSHLNETNVALTPDESLRNTDLTAQFVNSGIPGVPMFFMGQPFRGNESNVPFGTFWNDGPTIPIANRARRHDFSLNTCSGCHMDETRTLFTHIKPAPFGTPAGLSGFMNGIDPVTFVTPFLVNDPADGAPTRNFNEFRRRAIDLDLLVHSHCFFDIHRNFVVAVH